MNLESRAGAQRRPGVGGRGAGGAEAGDARAPLPPEGAAERPLCPDPLLLRPPRPTGQVVVVLYFGLWVLRFLGADLG